MTDATPTLTDEQKFGATLLTKGSTLAEAREQNTKDTARNRMLLRGLADEGALTDEQLAKVNELYPKPQRKPKPAPAPAADGTDTPTPPAPADAPAPTTPPIAPAAKSAPGARR